jgi:hypothetical protein
MSDPVVFKINPALAKLVASLLEQCVDQLSNNGCNDLVAPMTIENVQLELELYAKNEGMTVEEFREKSREYDCTLDCSLREAAVTEGEKALEGDMYFYDWWVLSYFKDRLDEAIEVHQST